MFCKSEIDCVTGKSEHLERAGTNSYIGLNRSCFTWRCVVTMSCFLMSVTIDTSYAETTSRHA